MQITNSIVSFLTKYSKFIIAINFEKKVLIITFI